MKKTEFNYEHQGVTCCGFVAHEGNPNQPRPAVLVVHDWSGCNEFACQHAIDLSKKGYVGIAVDMYGNGKTGQTNEEKQALMMPLLNDRNLLLGRLLAALSAAKSMPAVDATKIAAIGFCFGGLCVLDLARSGEDVKGVVSLHGLLNAPEQATDRAIKANVLVLHGYDDPMVDPQAVQTFCDEMTQKKADWQVHMYGGTVHAFTNPLAQDAKLGTVYSQTAAKRAFESMDLFLQACLQ
ncbi:dienelactone hydrolase family protein [Legionella sp. W05-934-2]|jgi:dienelactone hydrolase|uniref:dienelactone hydrolase family protein n=1 Tax=Legionella sp. W05-934-2 TaxID=1198649 RepID=UPI0034625804